MDKNILTCYSDARIEKPWGYYIDLVSTKVRKVKVIVVNPGQTLSLQLHRQREELWTHLFGNPLRIDGNKREHRIVGPGDITPSNKDQLAHHILPYEIHALGNGSNVEPAAIIEMQIGECDEDDIVRLEDMYGRTDITLDTIKSKIEELCSMLPDTIALKLRRMDMATTEFGEFVTKLLAKKD